MDELIKKYKVTLSVGTIIIVLGWVWMTSRLVTAKENNINQRIAIVETATQDNKNHIYNVRARTVDCETATTVVRGDINLIQKDISYMRGTMERIEKKLDGIQK